MRCTRPLRQQAFLGLLALACAGVSLAQLPPVVSARLDVDGTKDGVPLLVVSPPKGGTAAVASWHAEEEKNKQYLTFQAPTSATEWREMSFSFMPLKSGSVRLSLRGQWHKPAEEVVKIWVLFDDVSVTNAVLQNGDFERETGGVPAPWSLSKRDGFLAVHHKDPGRAHGGQGCVEVCHDLDGSQTITVQANATITVRAWHRRGE